MNASGTSGEGAAGDGERQTPPEQPDAQTSEKLQLRFAPQVYTSLPTQSLNPGSQRALVSSAVTGGAVTDGELPLAETFVVKEPPTLPEELPELPSVEPPVPPEEPPVPPDEPPDEGQEPQSAAQLEQLSSSESHTASLHTDAAVKAS